MGKYEPLVDFLNRSSQSEIRLTFDKIEQIIGRKLPRSAMKHRAWWSNNPMNSVMTKAWLDAGWKSEQVDLSGGQVTFRKIKKGKQESGSSAPPLFGCLKGTVRIPPGYDLTEPTGAEWAAQKGKLHE